MHAFAFEPAPQPRAPCADEPLDGGRCVARLQAHPAVAGLDALRRRRGNVLAGGVGYFAFFSIFPAVALAFTVFGSSCRTAPTCCRVADALEQYLPGFVKDAQHPNGIIPVKAPGTGALTVTGLVALVGLVLAGLGWIGALRDGIRAVFGVEGAPGNIVTNKLRDLGVLVTIGLGVAVSAVLTSTVGGAAGWVAEHVGLGDNGWVVTLVGVLVGCRASTPASWSCCCGSCPACRCRRATWCRARCSAGWASPS